MEDVLTSFLCNRPDLPRASELITSGYRKVTHQKHGIHSGHTEDQPIRSSRIRLGDSRKNGTDLASVMMRVVYRDIISQSTDENMESLVSVNE